MTIGEPDPIMRDCALPPALPSPWVVRFAAATPRGARALDVACGSGRHIHWLCSRGIAVTGVDRDLSAVRAEAPPQGATLIEADLEQGAPPPWAPDSFDLVVVTNYLWRPLLPAIIAAVAGGGLLIYETFATGNAAFGRPSNPAFLLEPGELLAALREQSGQEPGLTAVAYEHVRLYNPDRVVQRLCAAAPGHAWIQGGAPVA